jgi:hypothetical protein
MKNVGITSFFNFYIKLAKSSFLCRFCVESINVFVLPRFDLSTCSSINKQLNKFIIVFFIYSFFQEKTIGDISFKLETKISLFFSKKNIIKSTQTSIICNTICLQFSLYQFECLLVKSPLAHLIISRLLFRSLPDTDNCYK